MSETPSLAIAETKASTSPLNQFAILNETPDPTRQRIMKYRQTQTWLGLWLCLFFICHLTIAVSGLCPRLYQSIVDLIHRIPGLLPLSLLLIMLPLAVHAGLGLYLLYVRGLGFGSGSQNHRMPVHVRLCMTAQRVTGPMILVFALVHIGTMHRFGLHLVAQINHATWLTRFRESGLFLPDHAFTSTVVGLTTLAGHHGTANLLLIGLELLCIWTAVFHCTNGLWAGRRVLLRRNNTKSNEATSKPQPNNAGAPPWSTTLWNGTCTVLGIILFCAGTFAWWLFTIHGTRF